jgi:hypothetical protein
MFTRGWSLVFVAALSGWLPPGAGPVATLVAADFDVVATDEAIDLRAGGQLALRYNIATIDPPPGIDPVYRRSGFIHPVLTPAGHCVTADFPADHPHQHGIFCAWVNTTFDSRPVDFWNQSQRTGAVEHVRVVETSANETSAQFTVELRHVDLTAPGGPTPVLSELWTVRLLDHPAGRLFEIESRQTCVAASPLIVHEYHYGGLAFRGCDDWFTRADGSRPEFEFLTSEGLNRIDGNHTRPDWVVARGPIDGAPCGIAMFGHPENFRHPQPVRLHPDKPYFVFSPCVLGEFEIRAGREQVNRYHLLTFDGALDGDALDAIQQDYRAADPLDESVLDE